MDKKITILIADDHQYIIDGFVVHLHNIDFVGAITTVNNGDGLLEKADQQDFDLIITDIEMPGKSGVDVCRTIRKKSAKQKIMVVTSFAQSEYVRMVMKCKPNAILDKGSVKEEIENAIKDVFNGYKYYSPSIQTIIDGLLTGNNVERQNLAVPSLTGRQREALKLIAKGMTNKQIGKELFLTPHAISSMRSVLFEKFGVNNAVTLAAKAAQMGLLD